LDILVENLGRINFGKYLLQNKKGITQQVLMNNKEILNWQMFSLPFENADHISFKPSVVSSNEPVIKKASFSLDQVADTYLDMENWGKGVVWVNGHNLGRYWNIGPQQTLYLPAEWLKKGNNEIVVLELLKPEINELQSVSKPILDHLAVSDSGRVDAVDNYKLVWADEFNTDGAPDAKNWKFEQGFVRNNELQWYQPQNARCSNGMLVIEARKEHLPNPLYNPQGNNWKTRRQFIEYTAASLNTAGLQNWKYGRFVMRARIDTSAGLWPAFWTLGVKGAWPSNGEIDIMEYYRKEVLANIACATNTPYHPKWYSNTKAIKDFGGTDWAEKFHIWRMDWDEKGISLYIDDELLTHVDMDQVVNQDGSGISPFTQPQYMLLDLAIGGDNGGNPSATTFPRKFEIDYVRVYQK
jgi:beta-glucanase (GH16 family)